MASLRAYGNITDNILKDIESFRYAPSIKRQISFLAKAGEAYANISSSKTPFAGEKSESLDSKSSSLTTCFAHIRLNHFASEEFASSSNSLFICVCAASHSPVFKKLSITFIDSCRLRLTASFAISVSIFAPKLISRTVISLEGMCSAFFAILPLSICFFSIC